MATLTSAYNPSYSENASILTGNPNRVIVEIEDSIDKGFWENILKEQCPSKDLHFNPYHTVLNDNDMGNRVKGKTRIMEMADQMNDWHIGCIDSDYDWILSDYCNKGKTINDNKYLLQTYAYSFENLVCLSSTLNDFCQETTEECTDIDFNDYVQKVSEVIYPLLIWSVYLYSKGNHDFTPTAWHDILISTLNDTKASLELIKERVKAKLDELNTNHTSEIAERNNMQDSLSNVKSITKENAYLFVRGHELFDHLVNSILKPIIGGLRTQHYNTINKLDMDKDARTIALKDYSNKQKSVKDLLYKNYRYKEQTFIYDMICKDVEKIWTKN
ncbi:MAG: DUF4435 domain-containing protein [Bacteroidaceae bacterium]|nr:DUF4435 domain-containing protein [Bacteroidaceae bacterium]